MQDSVILRMQYSAAEGFFYIKSDSLSRLPLWGSSSPCFYPVGTVLVPGPLTVGSWVATGQLFHGSFIYCDLQKFKISLCKNFWALFDSNNFSVKFYLKEVSILSTYQILSTHTYINFTFTTTLQRRFAVSNFTDGDTES